MTDDEITKPDNAKPMPDPVDLLKAVGEFSEEMRASLQAVKQSGALFVERLQTLERQFDRRIGILTDEVTRVSQQQVAINERMNDHGNRIERLEIEVAKLLKS